MTDDRIDKARRRADQEADWERSERASFWVALAIALVPIPVSVLISWALGAPPWRPNPRTGDGEAMGTSAAPERPGPGPHRGPR